MSIGLYLFLVYETLYRMETNLLVAHAVNGDTLPPLLPRKWITSYIICCKELGNPGSDEKMLFLEVGNIVSTTPATSSNVDYEIAGTLLEAFVSRKLDVNHVNRVFGLSPLHSGVIGNQEWFVNKLLLLGADPCVKTSEKRKTFPSMTPIQLGKTIVSDRSMSSRLGDEQKEVLLKIIHALQLAEQEAPCEVHR